jgi:hypothetical protein
MVRHQPTTIMTAAVHHVGTVHAGMTIVAALHLHAATTTTLAKTATGHHVADRQWMTIHHRHVAATQMIAMELHRHRAAMVQSQIHM